MALFLTRRRDSLILLGVGVALCAELTLPTIVLLAPAGADGGSAFDAVARVGAGLAENTWWAITFTGAAVLAIHAFAYQDARVSDDAASWRRRSTLAAAAALLTAWLLGYCMLVAISRHGQDRLTLLIQVVVPVCAIAVAAVDVGRLVTAAPRVRLRNAANALERVDESLRRAEDAWESTWRPSRAFPLTADPAGGWLRSLLALGAAIGGWSALVCAVYSVACVVARGALWPVPRAPSIGILAVSCLTLFMMRSLVGAATLDATSAWRILGTALVALIAVPVWLSAVLAHESFTTGPEDSWSFVAASMLVVVLALGPLPSLRMRRRMLRGHWPLNRAAVALAIRHRRLRRELVTRELARIERFLAGLERRAPRLSARPTPIAVGTQRVLLRPRTRVSPRRDPTGGSSTSGRGPRRAGPR
ncbi:hypothetical protein GCG21_12360 [Pseudactinotalea sp. HY160]|uniref:hypothetical protein n=1 Tax=Pseudactinotalea sp. HY160 TaxID=2654490 RepID=UPI00128BB77D|nr:hypothetical protein [Pseudactinotalea sp. HY160]MPV50786.1 hypothetical protein [Pseudactinotalea sp. HY160]